MKIDPDRYDTEVAQACAVGPTEILAKIGSYSLSQGIRLSENDARAMSERIVVAMSGGVDSSVAAALLAESGAETIGVTMRLSESGSRCCSLEDADDARRVADQHARAGEDYRGDGPQCRMAAMCRHPGQAE